MSKKTPKNAKVKTKSARKKAFIVFSLAFIVILSFALFGLKSEKSQENIKPVATCLQINQKCFDLEVADSEGERQKGLSDRDVLAEDTGMLFVFDRSEEQCFWMKEMRFSIDMVWLNERKEIIKLEKNVPPSSYPDLFCSDNTKYVLEFNNGFAENHGLKPGTTLQF